MEVDYTSTPTINDQVTVGESGWYQYVYTIKASNFAQDGVYKMSLSSKYATVDAPENESTSVPENSKDQKGEGILDTMTFTVDNTAPEIRNVINLDKAIADKDKIVDGKLNVQYLFKNNKIATLVYSIAAVAFIFLGSLLKSALVWELTDFFNYLMVLPNALALFALTGMVVKSAKEGIARKK